jgi:hypothetical protein
VREYRLLPRLWPAALAVVIAAGGVLLTDGVSNATTPTVNAQQAMATDTSIELTTCPGSPVPYGTPVILTAKVTPATATGTVQFTDMTASGTSAGTSADLATVRISGDGTAAVFTETLKAGSHTLTAAFTPDDTTSFSKPTPAAVQLTVTGMEGSRSLQMVVPQQQLSRQSLDGQPFVEARVPAPDGRPLFDTEEWSVRDRPGLLGTLLHALRDQ